MNDSHEIHFIRNFELIGEHELRLAFEDGFVRDIDLSPVLYGKVFAPLRDPSFFKQVRLEPDFHTIEWPNGADFDPETLYHWDRYRDGMIEMAKKWKCVENTEAPSFDALDLIDEHDHISLTKDIPSLGLVSGDIGTVVAIYADGKAFEVEFMTAEGKTIDVITLERENVRALSGHEILHAREMEPT